MEAKFGANPYKFGMVGSTDSHTGLATAQEDNFFGKRAGSEPAPERMLDPFTKTDKGVFEGWEQAASGLAAVWALANNREPISDAMAREEVYATTVPVLLGYLCGRKILKLNPVLLLGGITGSMTSGASLSIVTKAAQSSVPAPGYTGAYAFASKRAKARHSPQANSSTLRLQSPRAR